MSEWNASHYNHISTLQKKLAEEELHRLKVAGSERVLDVGCGDGNVTAEIAGMVPRGSVLGVDPSHNMVAYAAAHFLPRDYANLRFEVGDARTLPYQRDFDLVVSFNALHWVHEQDQVLRSLFNALKPGGRANLRFVPKSDFALEYVIEDTRQSPRWAAYFDDFRAPFAHFPPAEYEAFAKAAGFAVDHIQVEDGSWDFQTGAAFADFCRATFVEWLRWVPDAERDFFIADVLSRYRVGSGGGQNEFRFQQMEVALVRPK